MAEEFVYSETGTHKLRKTIHRVFNVQHDRARYKTIRKRVIDSAKINGLHMYQLIAAMVIASIGLNVDSTEAVIGAMLICPLMGSVLAIAYSVASVDARLLRDAFMGLLAQVIVCLATSTLYFILSPLARTTQEITANSTATVWDLLIAFVGGFAGALGTSRKQEPGTLIAGVAVATSLMPPLCAAGYGIAARELAVAVGAFHEFLINVAFIAFGAEIVLILLRVPLKRDLDGDGIISEEEIEIARARTHSMRGWMIAGSLLLAIPCVFFSARVVRSAIEEQTFFESYDTYGVEYTTEELRILYPKVVEYYVGSADSYNASEEKLESKVVATVVTSSDLSDIERTQIQDLIELNVNDLDEVHFQLQDTATQDEDAGKADKSNKDNESNKTSETKDTSSA